MTLVTLGVDLSLKSAVLVIPGHLSSSRACGSLKISETEMGRRRLVVPQECNNISLSDKNTFPSVVHRVSICVYFNNGFLPETRFLKGLCLPSLYTFHAAKDKDQIFTPITDITGGNTNDHKQRKNKIKYLMSL